MTSEHRSQRPKRRSPRRATVGAAVMCLSAFGATTGVTLAQGAPNSSHHKAAKAAGTGSDLGALNITASSSAVRMPLYSHTLEDVDADIPYSYATLGTGGIGNGLTSIFYPGGTGSHGGDTLNLLGLGVPASIGEKLNDPEIAQAQTGVGAGTVDMSHPGLTMKAAASSTDVSAQTAAGGSGVPAIGPIVGSTTASSDIHITGPRTVTVDSLSSVHDISIAKVIKIGAVTSIAHAVTDGHKARGKANTVVSGVTIAGVPATIDDKGVHVSGKSLPIVGNTAAKTVNTALKSSGIKLTVTPATSKIHKAHAVLNAGALVVSLGNSSYKSNLNDTGTFMVIGGAQIDAQASPGFPPPKPIKPVKTPKQSSTLAGGTAGTPGTPGTPGTAGVPTAGASSQGGATVAPPPLLAADRLPLPDALKAWWVVLALIGAGMFAFGMKRLPDRVLQPAGTTCRLEE